jgi:predicted TIM-barrel fold metal-dependent hydrolase
LDEGPEAFKNRVFHAAESKVTPIDQFVSHLDAIGVEWGITVSNNHDNQKTGEIVRKYPKKFKGFIFVDPHQGMDAVRELERSVKEYGLHALYITAFRTRLPSSDKKIYPLYSKACELGIPVHIYSSLNLSKAVPYDIGHPRYIDEIARDFPELRIMAGVSGRPWCLEFFAVAMRHENVYLNFETHAPARIGERGSGYEPYLYYMDHSLRKKICFATNWVSQSIPIESLARQVEELPISEGAKDDVLYNNAKRFYET